MLPEKRGLVLASARSLGVTLRAAYSMNYALYQMQHSSLEVKIHGYAREYVSLYPGLGMS